LTRDLRQVQHPHTLTNIQALAFRGDHIGQFAKRGEI
jgi:hypothetical protein